MYKLLLKPVLFQLDAEKAHHFVFARTRSLFRLPFVPSLFKALYTVDHPALKREVFGLTFKNPVGLGAGLDKNAELVEELAQMGFGFIEIGTVTPQAQSGNDKPRLFRLPKDKALINRMGFNNDGVTEIARRLRKRHTDIIIGGNIGKNKFTPNENAVKDYIICFDGLFDVVDYFVVNVSSPNTPNLRELQEKGPLTHILQTLQERNREKRSPKPILLKIAPDLTDSQLDDIIDIVQATGISGVIAANTTISRSNLLTPEPLIQSIGQGGLSGQPLKKRSTEVIRYLHQKSGGSFPIIGVGGIGSAEDALQKIEAGAALVQLYTGFIYEGPALIKEINRAIVERNV
jgi:dihydroorotate dehydrogenase